MLPVTPNLAVVQAEFFPRDLRFGPLRVKGKSGLTFSSKTSSFLTMSASPHLPAAGTLLRSYGLRPGAALPLCRNTSGEMP